MNGSVPDEPEAPCTIGYGNRDAVIVAACDTDRLCGERGGNDTGPCGGGIKIGGAAREPGLIGTAVELFRRTAGPSPLTVNAVIMF